VSLGYLAAKWTSTVGVVCIWGEKSESFGTHPCRARLLHRLRLREKGPPIPVVGLVARWQLTASRVFLPTVAFLPLGSGNGWYRGIPRYTAKYRSNSTFKPKPLVQTVWRGIPRYKLFIPLQIKRPPGFE
jgi:hypothetical protein